MNSMRASRRPSSLKVALPRPVYQAGNRKANGSIGRKLHEGVDQQISSFDWFHRSERPRIEVRPAHVPTDGEPRRSSARRSE